MGIIYNYIKETYSYRCIETDIISSHFSFFSIFLIFWWTKILNFNEVQSISLFLYSSSFLCAVYEVSSALRSWKYYPLFSSRSFIVLPLTLGLQNVWFIFMCDVKWRVKIYFFPYEYPINLPPLFFKSRFLHDFAVVPLLKLKWR